MSELTATAYQCPIMSKALQIVDQASPEELSSVNDNRSSSIDYQNLFQLEVEKKHKDKSYRYFNNINRLARQFPRAYTPNKLVTVWCSNDYL